MLVLLQEDVDGPLVDFRGDVLLGGTDRSALAEQILGTCDISQVLEDLGYSCTASVRVPC